ncbi:MAG: hypothetical protein U0003_01795 [Vampirovibrionales bacterium]
MPSSVLDVVIEESVRTEQLDTLPFMALQATTHPLVWQHHHKRVFKEYILSPEVYPLQVGDH